ncbi:hypothetical protein KUCAC02_010078, partial [Chaenocephalus aceratus]
LQHTAWKHLVLAVCWPAADGPMFIDSTLSCHIVQADLCQLPAREGQEKLTGADGTDL